MPGEAQPTSDERSGSRLKAAGNTLGSKARSPGRAGNTVMAKKKKKGEAAATPPAEAAPPLPAGVKLVRTLRGHTNWIGRIAWSPDGRMLASPSEDRTIRLWDTTTGEY